MMRVLVLGYFGYETNKLNGQTVKTRDVYRLAKEQIGENCVDYFDTQSLRRSKSLLFQMFRKVMRCNTLFYLPAHNNLKIFFPIIYCLAVLCHVKIHYFVVGGWLREFITHLPLHRYMLRRIAGIHVETKRLKKELEDYYHYNNVDIFPNFRFFKFEPKPMEADKVRDDNAIKLCFVSRVEQSKGLDTLREVATLLAEQKLESSVKIDFYGQKTDEYFDRYLSDIKMFEYRGVLQPDEVVPTLKRYDALIFPSHYAGEGCPGILVEALFASLPIIASDWKYNDEFVTNGDNGYLCETLNPASYVSAIKTMLANPTLRKRMAERSYDRSRDFSVDRAREMLVPILKD